MKFWAFVVVLWINFILQLWLAVRLLLGARGNRTRAPAGTAANTGE